MAGSNCPRPDETSSPSAPAQSAAVERRTQPNSSPARVSNALTGKHFAVFTPNPVTQRQDVRFGIVEAQLGPDSWLLTFDAGSYKFSNVFSLKALEGFVFFLGREEQQAFLADILARSFQEAPKTNAGRGRAGTMLGAGAA